MLRFLFGIALGAMAANAYMKRQSSGAAFGTAGGHVDELSSAGQHPPMGTGRLNAGDGTPEADDGLEALDLTSGVSGSSAGADPTAITPSSSRSTTGSGQTSDAFNGS